jgi:hypothetical protein
MPTSDSFNRWQTIKLNGDFDFDDTSNLDISVYKGGYHDPSIAINSRTFSLSSFSVGSKYKIKVEDTNTGASSFSREFSVTFW